jgi:hypothetical protein
MGTRIYWAAGKPGIDFTEKSGHAVKSDTQGVDIIGAATDRPVGVIDTVNTVNNELGIALPGAVTHVKVSGAVKRLGFGALAADGTVTAATFAAGETVICQFLGDGVADETVEALILTPVKS